MGPPLYRFFLARFRKAVAEELVQEVFVRLAQSENYAYAKGKMESFVWGIAFNVQRETLRREKKSPLLVEEPVDQTDPRDPSLDDDVKILRDAIACLEEPELTIFQFLLADCEIQRIATALSMPEGTVKSHIHRGKQNLKEIFKKWGHS